MESLPNDWLALAAFAFLLGARHGLDADHLVTIDGLTRFNAATSPRLARLCGALFSLGHGTVVIAVAAAAGLAATRWQVPAWLEQAGVAISVSLLFMLGVMNLQAVLRTPSDEMVRTVGVRGRWFARLQATRNPWMIGSIGALFAVSFDTVSQAAAFAVAAVQFGGVAPSTALALCFVLGMLIADGLNGVWIARLIRRADRAALIASRVLGATIAALSFAVAALGLARLFAPGKDAWFGGDFAGLQLGVAVTAMIACASMLATRGVRRAR